MDNKSFDIENPNLFKFLTRPNKFYIPCFQRDYCWKLEQFDKLFNDTYESFKEDKDKEFFLGSLVFTNKNDQSLEIIDGQQRFTTINIILMIIICCFEGLDIDEIFSFDKFESMFFINPVKEIFKLNVQNKNDTDYKRLFENLKKDKNLLDSESNVYFECADYFLKKFKYLKEEHELELYLKYFFNKIIIVTISSSSLEDCFKIFEIVNSRGLELEQSDLIKNILYKKYNNENGQSKLNDLYTRLDTFTNDNEDLSINDIFSYFVISKKGENLKRNLYVEFEDILNNYDDENIDIILELKDFLENFNQIINEEHKYIYSLKYLPWKTYINTILISIQLRRKGSEKYKLLSLVRRFYYYSFISEISISNIKQTTFNLIKKINNCDSTYYEIFGILEEKMKELKLIEKAEDNLISLNNYKKKYVKPLLASLEYELDPKRDFNIKEIIIDKNLTIDHIIPQSFSNCPSQYGINDQLEIDEINKCIHNFGNLTLLSGIKNSKIRDWNFEQKAKLYKGERKDYPLQTDFYYTKIVGDSPSRNLESIEKRNKYIVEAIKNMLS